MTESPRQIALLGSTGSIGRSTLEVVRHSAGRLKVVALSAHRRRQPPLSGSVSKADERAMTHAYRVFHLIRGDLGSV